MFFKSLSVSEQAALAVWSRGFNEHFASEIGFFSAQGLWSGLPGVEASGWALLSSGNSLATEQALRWSLKHIQGFEISQTEFDRALQAVKRAAAEQNEGFTAHLGMAYVSKLLNKNVKLASEIATSAAALDPNQVNRLIRRIFLRANLQITASGDQSTERMARVVQAAREVFRSPLTELQQKNRSTSYVDIQQSVNYWRALPETQKPESMALIRRYAAVTGLGHDLAALQVSAQVLSNEIFALNRATKGLGYVHGARAMLEADRAGLTLFGQTEGRNRWAEIQLGWNDVLATVRNRTLSHDGFTEATLGKIRATELQPPLLAQSVTALANGYRQFKVLDLPGVMAPLLRSLTTDSIYGTLDRVLAGPSLDAYFSHAPKPKPECGGFFSSLLGTRKKLNR